MDNLKGKLALVTGGSSGIGRGIAEALARAGADVVICARNERDIMKTAQEITEATRAKCLGIPCDVTSRESVAEMMKLATENRTARVDILVNNAGIARFAPIRELDEDTWDAVINTNLHGPYNVLRAALPCLHEGTFVCNIASIAAVHPFAGGAAYNASKAGLYAFSEAIMQDLRKEGIRVCCINSGSVNTRLEGPDGQGREPWKMEPEDIGQIVVDLVRLPARALPDRLDIRPTQTS